MDFIKSYLLINMSLKNKTTIAKGCPIDNVKHIQGVFSIRVLVFLILESYLRRHTLGQRLQGVEGAQRQVLAEHMNTNTITNLFFIYK